MKEMVSPQGPCSGRVPRRASAIPWSAGRAAFWEEVLLVAEAVQDVTRSPKLNYEIHGNTVPHLHLHLFPRYQGDPYEGRAIDPRTGLVFERSDDQLSALRDGIVRGAATERRDRQVD